MTKKKNVSNLDNNVVISAFLCERRDHIFGVDIYFLCIDPAFNSSVPIKLSSRICLTHRIFIPFYLMDGQHTSPNNVFISLNQIKL